MSQLRVADTYCSGNTANVGGEAPLPYRHG